MKHDERRTNTEAVYSVHPAPPARRASGRASQRQSTTGTLHAHSPLSIISLGDVGGGGGVTDRATRGACSAGSGWAEQYLTSSMGEPQNPSSLGPITPRLAWIRTTAGMEASCFHLISCPFFSPVQERSPILLIVKIPVVQEGRGLGRRGWGGRAGNGGGGGRGGSAVQKASINNVNEEILLGRS